MKRYWLALCLCGLMGAQAACAAQRVVSLGGSVTEIIYELGQGGRLVADDESSVYPEAATRLPRVGYYRTVPLEGVVAMRPDLVLASRNAGPPKTLERLRGLGVELVSVSDSPSIDSLYERIGQISGQLGVGQMGDALIQRIRGEVASAQALPATQRRALVPINRSGPFLGAGGGTAADAVLALAGLKNALAEQKGYKQVSAEGLVTLAPDMIIVSSASVKASGGMDKILAQAGVASTPAAREGRVVALDDLLILGVGPRVGQAIRSLKEAAR